MPVGDTEHAAQNDGRLDPATAHQSAHRRPRFCARASTCAFAPDRAFGAECGVRLDLHQRPSLLASEPVDVDASRVEQPIATKGNSTRGIR
jgi:hypothetical protein